jgi:hypothetical protein
MRKCLGYGALAEDTFDTGFGRIKVLDKIMKGEEDEEVLTLRQIPRPMVGYYLQETCQLRMVEWYVVPTETKYPTQQFRSGGPEDLVRS